MADDKGPVLTQGWSAAIKPVESDDVFLAHLSGLADLNAGVRDGHNGGLLVLGEGKPVATRKL